MASSAGTDDIGKVLARAFPAYIATDAAAVSNVVPRASHAGASTVGPVTVGDAKLTIPYRIYTDEPAEKLLAEHLRNRPRARTRHLRPGAILT